MGTSGQRSADEVKIHALLERWAKADAVFPAVDEPTAARDGARSGLCW